MLLILVLLVLLSGGVAYYQNRNRAPYKGLVPVMTVALLICLLIAATHSH
jgi:hypothetical protein